MNHTMLSSLLICWQTLWGHECYCSRDLALNIRECFGCVNPTIKPSLQTHKKTEKVCTPTNGKDSSLHHFSCKLINFTGKGAIWQHGKIVLRACDGFSAWPTEMKAALQHRWVLLCALVISIWQNIFWILLKLQRSRMSQCLSSDIQQWPYAKVSFSSEFMLSEIPLIVSYFFCRVLLWDVSNRLPQSFLGTTHFRIYNQYLWLDHVTSNCSA